MPHHLSQSGNRTRTKGDAQMTIYVCNEHLNVTGCENQLTTHEMKCTECPARHHCEYRKNPEHYNHCYIETKGFCAECAITHH